jgi:hypothetical protein
LQGVLDLARGAMESTSRLVAGLLAHAPEGRWPAGRGAITVAT